MSTWPSTVDATGVRLTAAAAAVCATGIAITHQPLLATFLAADFAARTALGPHRAPLSIAARHITQALHTRRRPADATPKRFAAAIGTTLAATAAVATVTNHTAVATAAAGTLATFATLEATLGWCAGCTLWRQLHRHQLTNSDCVDCNNLDLHRQHH